MMTDNSKKLRRPRNGRVFFGVCAGLADFFGLDVTMVRAVFMIGTVVTLSVVFAVYLVLVLVVPEKNDYDD